MTIDDILDRLTGVRKVVHRGYSAMERQLGTVYDGWRIVARRRIPRWARWFYRGKNWEFIGEDTTIEYIPSAGW